MKKKQSVSFGFAVLVITAIFTIGSCEQSTDEENDDGGTPQTTTRSPITFNIKVSNSNYSWAITKIDFINGPGAADPVLETKTGFNIHTYGSGDYTVSGFTKAQKGADADTESRYVGIKVYASNGQTAFKSIYSDDFDGVGNWSDSFSFSTNDFSGGSSDNPSPTITRDPLGFTIKVTNNSSYIITKIEFINGIQSAAPVLETKAGLNISTNESGSYTVPGFTQTQNGSASNTGDRYVGIKVYASNAQTAFKSIYSDDFDGVGIWSDSFSFSTNDFSS
jgi:hypothetical protein